MFSFLYICIKFLALYQIHLKIHNFSPDVHKLNKNLVKACMLLERLLFISSNPLFAGSPVLKPMQLSMFSAHIVYTHGAFIF